MLRIVHRYFEFWQPKIFPSYLDMYIRIFSSSAYKFQPAGRLASLRFGFVSESLWYMQQALVYLLFESKRGFPNFSVVNWTYFNSVA